MDFYKIKERYLKNGNLEIYPEFIVDRSNDIMIRAKTFYAVWDEDRKIWSTDEYDVRRLVDKSLYEYADKRRKEIDTQIIVKPMRDFSTNVWVSYRTFLSHMSDNYTPLDNTITFQNMFVTRNNYVSKFLPYSLEEDHPDAYEEMISTLYTPEEREKIEWAIGSVLAGDSRHIQKFFVFYGEAGTGKSTVMNLIAALFEGYTTSFDAKALTGTSNSFSTEVFRGNPLVAIQHDGDLSRIEDNTKINSIVSHEYMTLNEKYKPSYTSKINAMLFMGTNKPIKITDAKSGIIRRLVDIAPTGNKLPADRYFNVIEQMKFELGKIANLCLNVYKRLGPNYYNNYTPMSMMFKTDFFFNFVHAHYHEFKNSEGVTLAAAYDMYKAFCDESGASYKMPRYLFREELKDYFEEFHDRMRTDEGRVRSYYIGFKTEKIDGVEKEEKNIEEGGIQLKKQKSLLDEFIKDRPAQTTNEEGNPKKKWEDVTTTIKDIDTSELHFVRLDENHIVIDLDLRNEDGEKDLEINLKAANKFPETYTEVSKSGKGIHLHYFYNGDVEELSSVYDTGIEIKKPVGKSALRRKLSLCDNKPIVEISNLPKKERKVKTEHSIQSEQNLRKLITANLNKEIHSSTAQSISFIHKILEDAYNSELKYDITDLRPRILAFANNSTNQAMFCLGLVSKMLWTSKEASENIPEPDGEMYFFDVEVFKNLLLIVYKTKSGKKARLYNPSPETVNRLLKLKLVGYNNKRYDNHIIYARAMGYSNMELYQLSKRIIGGSQNALIGEAYNISFTDVYDYLVKRQSLKKWEIELGIPHKEFPFSFDEPLPEEYWEECGDYCENDVDALIEVFDENQGDFIARQILAELTGLTVNDGTTRLSEKLIFGNDKEPQTKFNCPDLRLEFPGYEYNAGVSTYKGYVTGEGGMVAAEPGMYSRVFVFDVASMHPYSIIAMNLFGPYTRIFADLVQVRIFIKHKDYESASKMFDGRLAKFLQDPTTAKQLSNSLKIVINRIYGLTMAKFPNKFRDIRNKENVVAKRGALFMVDLKEAVEKMGFKVIHVKTDSIKVPDATPELEQFIMDFGKKYGYDFEMENIYEKMCLVNDAVYIAKKSTGEWDACGAQFAHPYVFKTLFTKEAITIDDMIEVRQVTTALYLHYEETTGEYEFVGRIGAFIPVKENTGGGTLLRQKEEGWSAAPNTKGFKWREAERVKGTELENDIELEFHRRLVDAAIDNISKFGDPDFLTNDLNYDAPPWDMAA